MNRGNISVLVMKMIVIAIVSIIVGFIIYFNNLALIRLGQYYNNNNKKTKT